MSKHLSLRETQWWMASVQHIVGLISLSLMLPRRFPIYHTHYKNRYQNIPLKIEIGPMFTDPSEGVEKAYRTDKLRQSHQNWNYKEAVNTWYRIPLDPAGQWNTQANATHAPRPGLTTHDWEVWLATPGCPELWLVKPRGNSIHTLSISTHDERAPTRYLYQLRLKGAPTHYLYLLRFKEHPHTIYIYSGWKSTHTLCISTPPSPTTQQGGLCCFLHTHFSSPFHTHLQYISSHISLTVWSNISPTSHLWHPLSHPHRPISTEPRVEYPSNSLSLTLLSRTVYYFLPYIL